MEVQAIPLLNKTHHIAVLTVLSSLHEVKYPASIYGLFHLKK